MAVALARINGIQVGGRNLLKKSMLNKTSSDYLIAHLDFGDNPPLEGEEVTLSIKGKLGSGRNAFAPYNTDSYNDSYLPQLKLVPGDLGSDGVYRRTGLWKDVSGNKSLRIYAYPSSATSASTVEWIKLERGNQATDWSPAPEDLPTQKQVDDAQSKAIRANTDAIKALGKVALGDSLITHLVPSDQECLS